jgi:hypothetical protein
MKTTRTKPPKRWDIQLSSIDAQASPMKMFAPELPVRDGLRSPRDFQVEALESAIIGKLESAKSATFAYRKVVGEEDAYRVIKALDKTIELMESDVPWDRAIKRLDEVLDLLAPILDSFDDDCFDCDLLQIASLEEAAQMMGATYRLYQAEELLREIGFVRQPEKNAWVQPEKASA